MKTSLSTSEAASLLNVSVGSVSNWIDQGQLKAGKTPGGHRRVTADDLLDFLRRHGLPIPPELANGQPKVLVVDDEAAITRMLAQAIKVEMPQWQVLEANDGYAAGELVGFHKPNVVVLDLRMPNLDGYEVCRRIRGNPEFNSVRVIAISAYLTPENQAKIIECGADSCLHKPLDMAVLMNELRQYVVGKPRGK